MKAVLTHLDMNSAFQYASQYTSQRSLVDDICKENSLLIDSSLKPAPILLLEIRANRKLYNLLTRSVVNPLIQTVFSNSLVQIKTTEIGKTRKRMKDTLKKKKATESFLDYPFICNMNIY